MWQCPSSSTQAVAQLEQRSVAAHATKMSAMPSPLKGKAGRIWSRPLTRRPDGETGADAGGLEL